MRWKNFLLGVGIGFFSGYLTKTIITEKTNVSPEKVLQHIKSLVKKQGSISGSWILMQAEPYTKNEIQYTVYKGGISRNVNGTLQQFEFVADATTGTILEFSPLN